MLEERLRLVTQLSMNLQFPAATSEDSGAIARSRRQASLAQVAASFLNVAFGESRESLVLWNQLKLSILQRYGNGSLSASELKDGADLRKVSKLRKLPLLLRFASMAGIQFHSARDDGTK